MTIKGEVQGRETVFLTGNGLKNWRLEPEVGIEPTTHALQKRCSTAELFRRPVAFSWVNSWENGAKTCDFPNVFA